MANDAVVDKGRRRFLTATTAVVGVLDAKLARGVRATYRGQGELGE